MRWISFAFLLLCSFQLIAADDNVELKTIEAKGQPQRVRLATPQGSECQAYVAFEYQGKQLVIRQQNGNLDTEKNCKLLIAIDKKTQAITVQKVEQDGTVLFEKETPKSK